MLNEEDRKKIITLAIVLLIVVISVFYILPLFFKKENSGNIYPLQIILNEEELNLKVGESYNLVPELYPSNSNKNNIKWTTSDETIATVSEDGMIETIRLGTTVITAETENNLVDFVIVRVSNDGQDIPILELNMEDISLKVGTKKTFKIDLKPSTTQYKEIVWETNNNKVLTIDNNGEVYGLTVGKAVITAKVKINDSTTLSISSNVNVVKETTLSASSSSLKQLYPYKEQEVKVHISDSNVQMTNFEVYTQNNVIASISQSARIENNEYIIFKVKGNTMGNTNVVVKVKTAEGENLNLTIPVTIKDFSGISLDKSSVTLKEGENIIVNAKLSPATDVSLYPTCSTSDFGIVQTYATNANKEDYNGGCSIHGIKNGKATIVVTLQGKTKTINVNVTSK